MEYAALALAVLALVAAFRKRGGGGADAASTLESAVRRAEARAEEAEQRTARLEQFVKRLAAGKPLDPAMIEEGRLFEDVPAERAVDRWRAGAVVVDVRTRAEVEGGHVPGARWIPIDELEKRWREVPREGDVLVVCAVGGRSAAACDFLNGKGYENVANVAGGMSAWRGETARGIPGAA